MWIYYFCHNFLLYCVSGYSEVISRLHKRQIEQNRVEIIENLCLDVCLISYLQSQEVISSSIASTLQRTSDDAEKNAKLLDYILKQSKACLDSFQDILRNHRQIHVAHLFDEPGKFFIHSRHWCLKCCRPIAVSHHLKTVVAARMNYRSFIV